jgi:hypothetical protein
MNPFAGVSLLELLRFYAEVYVRITKELFDLQVCARIEEADGAITPELKNGLEAHLEITKRCCEKIGLQVSALHADELLLALKIGTFSSAAIAPLRENIERELSCRFYVGISEDRKAAFCESLKGWEDITIKFPFAVEDIEEMNKCYALCRYSAAVFHSLIVMEHGLVALGKLIGVTDPKEGWDASCKKLESIVKAGRSANATGLNFEFLEQLNTCIQTIKLAWRNKVNHASGKPIVMNGGFAPYVAEETIAATRSFMRRLIEGMP